MTDHAVSGEALRIRATELGVETGYHDVDGVWHEAGEETLARVVAVLESDRDRMAAVGRLTTPLHIAAEGPLGVHARVTGATLTVDGHDVELHVRHGGEHDSVDLPLDLPFGCHDLAFDSDRGAGGSVIVIAPPLMPRSEALAGRAGLFVPTYALWSEHDPLPSFAHLHEVARAVRRRGIDVVATLPLYATFLDAPVDPSPYSPVSRLHWNEVYLDDRLLPEAPLPPLGDRVDWVTLAERRRRQLLAAVDRLDDAGRERLRTFTATHPDVGAYARFRAGRASGTDAAAGAAAGDDERVELSHVLAQYLADQQLAAIRDDPEAAALALDLPIGSHPDGYEVWADPTMYADGMTVGAPPDTFFAEGQSWGFPPPLPAAMHASGQRTWRQLIERAGRYCDVLRIDHAMAVHRLWWVPDGHSARDGVYVQYPRDEILAVIAASAAAHGTTIVGEDLGTVPPEVSDAFGEWDMLGMYEEQFHLDDDPLPHIPARSVAGIRTHDMEPLAALVAASDTSAYRERLGRAHGADVGDRWQDLADHMLTRLAASDAYLVIADLDDLVGETRPHNLPGRVVEGLWSRRSDRPTPEIIDDPAIQHRLAILGRTQR